MYRLFKKYALVFAAITISILMFSCDLFQDSSSGSDSRNYRTVVANSNYDRTAKTGNTVYFDFSTGTVTSVDHNSWDLAISHSSSTIVANSGTYGSGVTVYKTDSTTITDDFSSFTSSYGHTYIDGTDLHGTQTSANPFSGEFTSGSGSGTVYLVQDVSQNYYKVKFSSFTPGGSYSIQVLAGLAATGSGTTINGTSDTAYGYTYFKLSSASDVTTAVTPKKDAFDVVFTPGEYIYYDSVHNHNYSSQTGFMVLINNEGNVQAATAEGSSIDQVLNTSGLSFSSSPSALGKSWYSYNPITYAITINTLTYVVKTTEGHYAKFQPASYANSDDTIKYYMTFRYYYQEDEASTFRE